MPATTRMAFSAWGHRVRALSEQRAKAEYGEGEIKQCPTECHDGLGDLFRLRSPSQGILFSPHLAGQAIGERGGWPLEPEGCPNGSGGFSAFNLPGPGRPKRFRIGDFGFWIGGLR